MIFLVNSLRSRLHYHVVYKDVKAITYVHVLSAFLNRKGILPIHYLATVALSITTFSIIQNNDYYCEE